MLQEMNKIQEVGIVEGAVLKPQQIFQIMISVMKNEVMWSVIHSLQKLFRLLDNDCAIAPGKNGSEQPADLYVLFLCKKMRNTNGIVFYESGSIVLPDFAVEKIFQLICHGAKVTSKERGYEETVPTCNNASDSYYFFYNEQLQE